LQAKDGVRFTVFPGSSLALWVVAALAVFVGNRAARLLDPRVMPKVAAVVLVGIRVILVAGAI
jgi:putative Ca2+/H+ antiporter (TMEM165/GDT1 family)